MIEVLISLLTDEHGISEQSFSVLSCYIDCMYEDHDDQDRLNHILDMVKATEGRYYLPEDWDQLADIKEWKEGKPLK